MRVTQRFGVAGTGPWVLSQGGDRVAAFRDLESLLFVLYRRCYGRAGEHLALAGWQTVHGGLVTIDGRRVLVVGDKGAGKTTLMMRLLADGHAVEGDENALTRDGLAVALPRRFHVKPGTAALVPELSDALADAPRTHLSDGTPIIGFDPTEAGLGAATRLAPVEVAVVLRSDAAEPRGWRPLSTVEAVQAAVTHAVATTDSRPALLAACAALLGQARGVELARADPAQMAERLRRAVNAPETGSEL